MIAGLKPYPEYKDSGVPWLGRVPAHWDVRRNGRLFSQRKEVGFPELPILEVSLKTGVRVREFGQNGRKQMMSDRAKYKRAIRGDITYNMMRLWQGAVGTAPEDGLVSPAYVVAKPHVDVDGRYYAHLFRTDAYMREVNKYSHGIVTDRNRLYWDEFKQMPSPFPPPGEQSGTVRFIAAVQERVRRALNAKNRLITLLNEEKQVIVHRLVTRGAYPHASQKPSGVPWLGDVPAHWKIRRLKQCITGVEQGWSPQCFSQPACEGEWGVLKVGCVNGADFNGDQNKRLPPNLAPDFQLEIRDGDILVSRANTSALIGLAAVARKPRPKLMLCDKLFRFRALDEFEAEFLVHSLRSLPSRVQIESSTNGASDSMQNIGQAVIKNLWIAAPPRMEQRSICGAIVDQSKRLNQSLAKLHHEVSLIREFQTRLIADVVTGQLDVRAAAERLPVDIEEPEHEPDVDEEADELLEEVSEDA